MFQVSIPRTVEIGQENIVLNCDYNFDAEEAQQLEVKWYFNKDPSPFFQWIAGLPDAKEGLNGFHDKDTWFQPAAKLSCLKLYSYLQSNIPKLNMVLLQQKPKYQINSFKPPHSPK